MSDLGVVTVTCPRCGGPIDVPLLAGDPVELDGRVEVPISAGDIDHCCPDPAEVAA